MTSAARLGGLLALALAVAAPASANVVAPPPLSPVPSVTWEPAGPVSSVERQGNVLYLAGSFTYLGPPDARFGAVVSSLTGEAPLGLPAINGEVRAVVGDGAGGWFIGGRFTAVNGQQCHRLAHVLADLSLDPAFCGTVVTGTSANGTAAVYALSRSSTRLYVGGMTGNGHEVLREDFFQVAGGRRIDPDADGMTPFFARVAREIRAINDDWLVFAELDPFRGITGEGFPPGTPERTVNASHWYDIVTLVTKTFMYPTSHQSVHDEGA